MATLTIPNLDEKTLRKLEERAVCNGRSMEAEARDLLAQVAESTPPVIDMNRGLGTAIHELFAPLGGVELELPSRISHRQIPNFE
jgi:plasmid stability protein